MASTERSWPRSRSTLATGVGAKTPSIMMSQSRPKRAGVETRSPKPAANVTVAMTAAMASAVPAIALRTGTAELPRPGLVARCMPNATGGGDGRDDREQPQRVHLWLDRPPHVGVAGPLILDEELVVFFVCDLAEGIAHPAHVGARSEPEKGTVEAPLLRIAQVVLHEGRCRQHGGGTIQIADRDNLFDRHADTDDAR